MSKGTPLPWPVCPTCHRPANQPERCTCGHLKLFHRIDLKKQACGVGSGLPGLACNCTDYQAATEAAGPTTHEAGRVARTHGSVPSDQEVIKVGSSTTGPQVPMQAH